MIGQEKKALAFWKGNYHAAPFSPKRLQPLMDSRAALARPIELEKKVYSSEYWTSKNPDYLSEIQTIVNPEFRDQPRAHLHSSLGLCLQSNFCQDFRHLSENQTFENQMFLGCQNMYRTSPVFGQFIQLIL